MLTLRVRVTPAPVDGRRGIVRLHPDVLSALGAAPWAVLELRAGRATAVLAALAPADAPRGEVVLDDLVLANAGAADGGSVAVRALPPVGAARVELAGPPEVVRAVSPEALRLVILGKAVTPGDQVSLLPQDLALQTGVDPESLGRAGKELADHLGPQWRSLLLQVAATVPAGPVFVTPASVVGWSGGAATESSAGPHARGGAGPAPVVLPGLERPAALLKEWWEVGLRHPDLLSRLGGRPQLGVLLTGPAGSGKSALAAAVAAQLGVPLVRVSAAHLAAEEPNAGRQALRAAVNEVTGAAPAVLLVEDVDQLVPTGQGPLKNAVLEEVAALEAAGKVGLACTSSRPDAVDPALRLPDGGLDHELTLPVPDRPARRALLAYLTGSMPLGADVDLDDVAGRTPGYVPADLQALCREAALRAAVRGPDPQGTVQVAAPDFTTALEAVRPSTLSEALPPTGRSLDDVGDLVGPKQILTETVIWPLSYPHTFERLGVSPPHGVLLFGPPGCGKTYLVAAFASLGQANLLVVKGAELLTKWVGESERGVRDVFRRAREAGPAIVFLDEVDALAPVRGQSEDGGTTDRVVAALLTELDGVEPLRHVVVVGATNRPELVDPALLRPGRLERLVYLPPPDAAARRDIMIAAARHTPLAHDVDLGALSDRLEGYSGADLAAVVREGALCAMRRSMDAPAVTAADLDQAVRSVRGSLDPAQLADLQAFAARAGS